MAARLLASEDTNPPRFLLVALSALAAEEPVAEFAITFFPLMLAFLEL